MYRHQNPFLLLVVFVLITCRFSHGQSTPNINKSSTTVKLTGQAPPSDMSNPFNRMEPVIFSVAKATEKSRQSFSKIKFNQTLTNIGLGWDSSRNEFNCFYPGVYFFTFSALSTPTSEFRVSLVKNGNEIVSTLGDKTGNHAGSNSAILKLDKNDRVYLNIFDGVIHESPAHGKAYTSFSGFRLN